MRSWLHLITPEAHFPLKMPDMPASELNRMMMMSANMDLGGEVTPVMALKLIRADERYDLMSLTELNELKDQLKAKKPLLRVRSHHLPALELVLTCV